MKNLLPVAFILAAASLSAQQAVPNGGFEAWTTTVITTPRHYPVNSNRETYEAKMPMNCVKVTDSYHGSSAVKLTTVTNATDTMFAYMINAQPDGDPMTWHGGTPYIQMATGIRGYYKADVKTGDTAYILVAFSKAGVNIGSYFLPITGQQNTYTLFTLPFFPALTQAPDSVIFGATSSNALSEKVVAGSMLQLDSISLTGVTSQPANFNGDFEDWDVTTVDLPDGWYHGGSRELVSLKSNDVYLGSGAVVVQTRLGEDNGQPKANPGHVGTGYYPRNCNSCNEMGGYPFTQQLDTLVFWYKFTPAGGALAEGMVKLKKNGAIIAQNNITLNAAGTFQRVELPFSASQAPDTLIVGFESSRWQDSLVTAVGSTLIVDEVQLKSAPLHTGLGRVTEAGTIRVFPNPAHDMLHVSGDFSGMDASLIVTNTMGQRVLMASLEGSQPAVKIETLPEGMYFFSVMHRGATVQSGKLLVK